jgi:hypothetical protein
MSVPASELRDGRMPVTVVEQRDGSTSENATHPNFVEFRNCEVQLPRIPKRRSSHSGDSTNATAGAFMALFTIRSR